MGEDKKGNWTAERVIVLTSDSDFFKEIEQTIPEASVYRLEALPNQHRDIENAYDQPPSIIVVDAMWNHSPEAWETVMKWPLGRKMELREEDFLALPTCLLAISRLNGFRSKGGWRNCLLLVVLPKEKATSFTQLCQQLGANWVLRRETGWFNMLPDVVSRLRKKRPLAMPDIAQRRLKVLVAENTVDVFLLLDALLEEFCDLVMSLDDHSQCLQDCRSLSAESIVRDFLEGSYGAVIVDMALSIRQEDYAKGIQGTRGRRGIADSAREGLNEIVNDNLEGLVAVKRLREANADVPICVFSNYVGHPGFRRVMLRYWGSRLFDSIAVFPKNPDGRSQLHEWLVQYSGYHSLQIINESVEGEDAC